MATLSLLVLCLVSSAVCDFIVPKDRSLGEVHIGTKIGETECFTTAQCSSIARSVCKEGLCQCLPTHVPHNNHDRCLRIASAFDEPCEIDKQCPLGSFCKRKMCREERQEKGSATTAPVNAAVISLLLLVSAVFL